MGKKLTTEEFIERAKKVHGDKYNYSEVIYINTDDKVVITCLSHNVFKQTPYQHLNRAQGCPKCGLKNRSLIRRKLQEQFIQEANLIHNNLYDYSLVNYKNTKTKVKIICKDHSVFELSPEKHINRKQGCKKCFDNKRLTINDFINKANLIHNNKFDYSKVKIIDYRNKITIGCPIHGFFEIRMDNHLKYGCGKCVKEKNYSKREKNIIKKFINIHGNLYDYSKMKYNNYHINVDIICKNHGIFKQLPSNHLAGNGCPKCFGVVKDTTNTIISKFIKIHGDRYDYSLVDYKSAHKKIKIICGIHEIFEQTANDHKYGKGCSKCKSSKGELKIIELFDDKIEYIRQYKFKNCKDKQLLPFDFYIPELNMCIEYNGIQHYESIACFGGVEAFTSQQRRDKIKMEYCKQNNISLLIIKYDEDIKSRLKDFNII